MLSRFGFGQEAITASGSDAELAVFLEKEAEEADQKKRKKTQKQKKRPDEDLPKLFMELPWSEQRKIGQKAPVLRQVEGDSINQRIRLYRRTIFFHIHSKLEHSGYIAQRLRLNNQNPNGKDEKGRTALHYACRHGAENAVRTLIHEEVTIDDPDLEMRWTPLHYAVMGGHETIVARLLDKAPVRRITINRKDKCGMTPLMLACGEDHAGIAKLLLRKKAFIDETDNDGWSALHYAAANDSALAAEVLVQYDINLKARTESTKETALEMAERLRSHLVAILLQPPKSVYPNSSQPVLLCTRKPNRPWRLDACGDADNRMPSVQPLKPTETCLERKRDLSIREAPSSFSDLHQTTNMTQQLTPLDAALQLFTTTQETPPSNTKPVVVLSLFQEPDRKQKRELQKLLTPLVFLFHGRDDITLVQTPSNDIDKIKLTVIKDEAEVATVTTEGELKDRVKKLVEHIGWSPDCPDETQLHNYLSPINAEELLGDVAAFTATTGQRDYVANAANVSSIIWHAFTEADRPINWAGFYFVRPLANPKETDHDHILILGPFMGKPACSRIRFQSGVCGASWRTKSVQRIKDVHEFPGHIACDDASESELVVPVFDKQGEVIALIDLDCPQKNGFSAEDERTFVEVARVMSEACDWGNIGLPYTQP